MNNTGKTISLLLISAILLVVVSLVVLPRRILTAEPVYQGRPLSQWLEDLDSWNGSTNAAVFVAIGAMGSNAVPELVRISLTPSGTPIKYLIIEKMRAYPKLKPLAPEDARILWNRANLALCILGPEARSALPTLLANINSTDEVIARRAISAIGFLGPEAQECIPTLVMLTNVGTRANVMLALGMIGKQPEVCLPVLTNGLADPDPIVSANANMAISFFGGFEYAKPVRKYKP